MKYIPVNNFRCRKCGIVGLSLYVHQSASCRCGNFVDGGFEYNRCGGIFEDMEVLPLYWKVEKCRK